MLDRAEDYAKLYKIRMACGREGAPGAHKIYNASRTDYGVIIPPYSGRNRAR
jgi:hypothetical protein